MNVWEQIEVPGLCSGLGTCSPRSELLPDDAPQPSGMPAVPYQLGICSSIRMSAFGSWWGKFPKGCGPAMKVVILDDSVTIVIPDVEGWRNRVTSRF